MSLDDSFNPTTSPNFTSLPNSEFQQSGQNSALQKEDEASVPLNHSLGYNAQCNQQEVSTSGSQPVQQNDYIIDLVNSDDDSTNGPNNSVDAVNIQQQNIENNTNSWFVCGTNEVGSQVYHGTLNTLINEVDIPDIQFRGAFPNESDLGDIEDIPSSDESQSSEEESDERDSDVEEIYDLASNADSSEAVAASMSSYCCPICLERPRNMTSTVCGHVFCEACINRLFLKTYRNWKCPVCQRHISMTDIHRIYI